MLFSLVSVNSSQKCLDRDRESLEQHLLLVFCWILANTKQDTELARVSKGGSLLVF